jgi:hypothetical protein
MSMKASVRSATTMIPAVGIAADHSLNPVVASFRGPSGQRGVSGLLAGIG